MSISPEHKSIHFREVWSDNLDAEFTLIQDVVENYRYVAMDTEYPGVVTRLIGNFKSHSEYNYQNMKVNVNPSNIIQVGLTFSDDQGNLPTCGTDKFCVWQFNFCEFNLDEDVYAKESIKLLSENGIDFEKNKEKGIKANRFIELLMSSGAVLNDNMRWVTFHGGYDIGYLIKLLTGQNLPDKQEVFLEKVEKFFPVHYDVKHLMKFCKGLGSGLDKLAKQLRVERVGTCHQAGSDSLLTSCTFMKLKEEYLKDTYEKHTGVLFGYGNDNGQITQ